MKKLSLLLLILVGLQSNLFAQTMKAPKMDKLEAQKAKAENAVKNEIPKNENHIKTMITAYLALNEALYSDNFDAAKVQVAALKTEVMKNSGSMEHKGNAENHAKHHGEMLAAVVKADAATEIKGIRNEYKAISDHLIMAVKKMGYEELLYVQHCPMANGNKGADWLSTSKDVLNPYYGKMMLKCGSVTETLEKK